MPTDLNPGSLVIALMCLAGVLAAFVLATTQSMMGAKVGSDHPVHAFLARAIRNNRHRLFVRIPRLLNNAHCAALPLYIHWLLSFFGRRTMHWAERLLNPSVNALHVLLWATVSLWWTGQAGLPPTFAALVTCLFALTPQFYHALSARNFGLSARGTGLLLLTAFYLVAYVVEKGQAGAWTWLLLAAIGWLIWGFSTFGQQALCIVSTLLLLLGGHVVPLAGTAIGLALFLALHPVYGRAYIRHTLKFIHAYATELAPIYVLARRHSVWRDLVQDIWVKLRTTGLKNGFRYAYENPVLVVLFLNPLVPLAAALAILHPAAEGSFLAYAGTLALAGLVAMLLTSFRPTRFLGEPERYVEVVTPWAVLAGASALHARAGLPALVGVLVAFVLLDLAQLKASQILVRHITAKPVVLAEVVRAVSEKVADEVRCCSNNEQLTKMLMQNDWWFAYCIAVGQGYCGMTITEAFSTFPNLRREACERIVSTYRINVCVLDRTLYDTIFDSPPAGLRRMSVGYESAGLRVLLLDWAP